jgi:hypothetical protein
VLSARVFHTGLRHRKYTDTPFIALLTPIDLLEVVQLQMATTDSKTSQRSRLPLYRLVLSQSTITDDVLEHQWEGEGTTESPYLVEWLHDDPRDPHQMQDWLKWSITLLQAASFLSITFASSSLSAANPQIQERFGASSELVVADTSLFVLAFAIGPAVWAPLSELYGRQVIYFITYGMTTLFAGATIASPNIATLLVLRFLSGAFGSSAISNAGGVVSDMYTARDRGLATIAFIGAPFLGPSLGPIACDFLAVSKGWMWSKALKQPARSLQRLWCARGFCFLWSQSCCSFRSTWLSVSLTSLRKYLPVLMLIL